MQKKTFIRKHPMYVTSEERSPVRRWDDWVRWLLGGLIAGLIAYAGIGSRMTALETQQKMLTDRADEDRKEMKDEIRLLTTQIQIMRDELRTAEMRKIVKE